MPWPADHVARISQRDYSVEQSSALKRSITRHLLAVEDDEIEVSETDDEKALKNVQTMIDFFEAQGISICS